MRFIISTESQDNPKIVFRHHHRGAWLWCGGDLSYCSETAFLLDHCSVAAAGVAVLRAMIGTLKRSSDAFIVFHRLIHDRA